MALIFQIRVVYRRLLNVQHDTCIYEYSYVVSFVLFTNLNTWSLNGCLCVFLPDFG